MIRDAQISPVYEGTNGIKALDLCGRKVAMERGMPMFALTKQIKDTVKQLSEVTDDDDCLAIADTLGKITKMLEDCTK